MLRVSNIAHPGQVEKAGRLDRKPNQRSIKSSASSNPKRKQRKKEVKTSLLNYHVFWDIFCSTQLFKSFKFRNASRMSRIKKLVRSARITKRYRTYQLFSFHSDN